ncbi:hypothetical protein PIB30_000130 [Stylosanthes scabra]|uniref:Uncharacterized protein n=1 Tax=Stylosanthes scabra TaxID=79078 RepID=A0ABU6R236_9FABA|nr:hypothetical protein [Stylosanthes scabra]
MSIFCSCSGSAISLVLLILLKGFVSGINAGVVDCGSVECEDTYIKINQGQNDGSLLVNGDIINTCPVSITDLRVDCGAFIRSGVPLPPNVLRPVGGNECVVNNGNPIGLDDITFQYSNGEILPIIVTSFKCLSPST